MWRGVVLCWLLGASLGARGAPIIPYPAEHPLTLVSELTTRLDSFGARLQEPRLPLPMPQDLEAIRKVAQILIAIGEQVIPAIIGELSSSSSGDHTANIEDVPHDTVSLDKLSLVH